jgi:Alginate lyase
VRFDCPEDDIRLRLQQEQVRNSELCVQRHVVAADFQKLVRVSAGALHLARTYYFTRREAYAAKAAAQLRAFFLDARTGMLPNLLHAQLRPGAPPPGGSAWVRHPPLACQGAVALLAQVHARRLQLF